jgi:hypothetical protein
MYQQPVVYVPYSKTAAGVFPPGPPGPPGPYAAQYHRQHAAWHNPNTWASYADRRSGFLSSLFGGGSKSTAEQKAITKTAADLITQNIMSCQGSQVVNQSVNVGGNFNQVRVKQVSYMQVSANCTQNAQNMSDLQTSITDSIMSSVKAQSQALIGALGRSDSEVRNTIENDVKQTVTQKNIQTMVNNVNLSQSVAVGGDNNIVDIDQQSTAKLVNNAAQELLNSMTVVQQLTKKMEATAETTQTNFISEIIESTFSGIAELAWIWAIVICVAIVFLGREVIKGGFLQELFKKKSGGDKPTG